MKSHSAQVAEHPEGRRRLDVTFGAGLLTPPMAVSSARASSRSARVS
jgi:hypothetical protein